MLLRGSLLYVYIKAGKSAVQVQQAVAFRISP